MLYMVNFCRWNFVNQSNSYGLIGKTQFLAAILNFPQRTGSRFWEPNFHMCILTIVIIWCWNLENLFISSRVIQENVVFGSHFEFSRANRKEILRTNIFHMCMLSIVIICRWNFENLFISSRVIQENVVFGGHFEFFWPNRK